VKSPPKLNNLKLAFITGATKGIGRSTVITFANAGWDLILLSRNMDSMEKLKNELLTTKSKINLVKCDLSNPLEIEHCVKEAIEKYGCPSVLILKKYSRKACFDHAPRELSTFLVFFNRVLHNMLIKLNFLCAK